MNSNQRFTLRALWNNCYKIAKVNVLDGRFYFFKKIVSAEEENYLTAPNISEYVQRIIDGGWIYPEDAAAYMRMMRLDNLRETILKKRIAITDTFRRLIGDKYYWMTLETMIPDTFSEQNPWVLFLWKDADAQASVVTDSMRMLARLYFKILKLNLTTEEYDVIRVAKEIQESEPQCFGSFIDCCRQMAESGSVHSDDKKEFLKFFDAESLRRSFASGCESVRFTFRRKFGEEFRWVRVMMYRSLEYSDRNQVVLVYMRDVNETYIAELNHRKELIYCAEHDELTGLGNRRKYNDDCVRAEANLVSAGAFFADLNGLKAINDNYGHACGDKYIECFSDAIKRQFGENVCYRISGDEFVVLFVNITESRFAEYCAALDAEMDTISAKIREYGLGERTIASVGSAWLQAPQSVEDVVNRAEKDMYAKKSEYYVAHPEYKRIS